MVMPKVALTIGRYRIIHKGHIDYLIKMIKQYDKVIICIGSCYEHGTKKNCILPYFIEKMLRRSLEVNGINENQYVIHYVSDYIEFDEWLDDILLLCKKYEVTHFVTGNKEDIIDVLKEKGYVLDMEFVNPEQESDFPYHASDLRKAIINNNFELLNELIPTELQSIIFGSPVCASIIAAEKDNAIHFNPGRQTTDFVVLLQNILDDDLYVLIGKRSTSKKDFPGVFGLPGGGIDKFETTINAACRELFEETGLDLEILKNTFEPATVRFKNVENPQISFMHFIGLYSSIDPMLSGTRGGSSQCFGMFIKDDISKYRKAIYSSSDLTEVDFYKVSEVIAKGLAYQQSDMLKRAMMIYKATPLLTIEQQEILKKTIIVAIAGASGAGKSVLASDIFSLSKKLGIVCELTGEFAKDQYYEGNLANLIHDQLYLLGEQNHRIERLIGKVDLIITDAPISICAMHAASEKPIQDAAWYSFKKHNNGNLIFFLERKNYDYEKFGRLESEEQSLANSKIMKKQLLDNGCEFITINSFEDAFPHILKLLKQINPKIANKKIEIKTVTIE